MQAAVVRVEEEGGEGTGLSSPVPAIGAVDQHAGAIEQGLWGHGGSQGVWHSRGREGTHLCREERGLHDELNVPQPAR